MHLIVVGLNHKTADVEIRERCYFPNETLPKSFDLLKAYPSLSGAVILSTCNRVEIYASVVNVKAGFDDITDFISCYHSIPRETLTPFLYKKNCQNAVNHLFKVISGIDSMVIGEYQIQGQVRDSYYAAQSNNATDSYLNKVFQSAINTGKRIRSETAIGQGTVSVATLATELIKKVFSERKRFHVLLIGAGKMAGLTAANLQEFNGCSIIIANRSLTKAEELAVRFNGKVTAYDKRYEAIQEADVIIVSTASENYTVQFEEVAKLMQLHPTRTKMFIDLSLPRNIDPAINRIENCMVYSIDDINQMIDLNVSKRQMEIEQAEKIISEVSEDYYNWYYAQIIMPTMHEIKSKLDILKTSTIANYKSTFGAMTDTQQGLIQEMMDAYSEKLIRVIMKNIKTVTSKDDMVTIVEALKNTLSVDTAINEEIQSFKKREQ
ncbi:glutamyl-tRNA reductase [Microbacter margulisiae]|uniref:Glutamyl-tRNA reductase n=1 Tax=Microbacter margulisiae TaxID=1350067 RepID=A0A7W5DPC4_9PORP|nr:glutamyl-tRNA reductase [Microbacter margulisiae]MBB3186114.1 glutamyl-tRNA reductase [Microbacter margulisiae]